MADENKRTDSTPEITSLSDEETITEIDLGSFLAVKDSEEVIYDGFHDDIKKTEKSIDDELQNLFDDIMSTGPVTAPRIVTPVEETKPASELESMWMNPDEYMEMPKVPAKTEPETAKPENSQVVDDAKNDIFNMIESLKTASADSESDFDTILSDIEANKGIAPANTDLKKTDELTADAGILPEPPAVPVIPEPTMPEPVMPEPVMPEPPVPEAPKATYETDTAEFKDELAALLGDEPKKEEPAPEMPKPKAKPEFVVNIPDEVIPEAPVYDALITKQRTIGVEPVEIIEDDGKISRSDKKRAKLEAKAFAAGKEYDENKTTPGDIVRRIIFSLSIIVIIISVGFLVKTYVYEPMIYRKNESSLTDTLDNDATGVVEEHEDSKYPAGMLVKYKQLYDINEDLRGWISIPSLEINLPVAQGENNDYYLHRNIYKKSTNYGVPFFDYRIKDFKNLPKNTVIYGHNMHYDDLIFGLLENYREIDGFKSAPIIECNTIYGDIKWKVYAVFITGSKSSQDNGYLFPYNFIDISDENFADYIREIDTRKFYTTGVDIYPTDRILTLSTCCYDFNDARLVVVARMLRDGESASVDTTRAVKNDNPRYPQAWYDANKKTNPYRDASNWNPYS